MNALDMLLETGDYVTVGDTDYEVLGFGTSYSTTNRRVIYLGITGEEDADRSCPLTITYPMEASDE